MTARKNTFKLKKAKAGDKEFNAEKNRGNDVADLYKGQWDGNWVHFVITSMENSLCRENILL